MKCPTCGTEYEGDFCPKGCNVTMQQTSATPQPPKKVKKKGKGCLVTLLVVSGTFIAFIVLVIVLASIFGDTSTTKKSELAKSELATVMELTEEQETTMLSIFENCGIGELSSVSQFQVGKDRTSYYIDDKETAVYSGAANTIIVWVDNTTKTVQEIYFQDATIYADGEVRAQVSDYYVSEEARNNYRVAAQMLVNECLSYPDTAKYESASGWRFGVRDGYDVCQSTVTAKNAFGVQNSLDFQVKFDRSTGAATSLIIDGEEKIK